MTAVKHHEKYPIQNEPGPQDIFIVKTPLDLSLLVNHQQFPRWYPERLIVSVALYRGINRQYQKTMTPMPEDTDRDIN